MVGAYANDDGDARMEQAAVATAAEGAQRAAAAGTVANHGQPTGTTTSVLEYAEPGLLHRELGQINRVLPAGELAEYVRGPVDGPRLVPAMRSLRQAGAQAVAVTRAGAPIVVLAGDDEAYEIVPPHFVNGFPEGCGDTMTGAVAAGLARGMSLRDALVLGAAAGSGNLLRHGLGTGRRSVIEALRRQVDVRPVTRTASGTAA